MELAEHPCGAHGDNVSSCIQRGLRRNAYIALYKALVKKIVRALKAGAEGFTKSFEPARYQAAGIPVRCTHCKGETFQAQEALLNTTGATFAHLNWIDKSGTALICETCGLIQWYAKKPDRL